MKHLSKIIITLILLPILACGQNIVDSDSLTSEFDNYKKKYIDYFNYSIDKSFRALSKKRAIAPEILYVLNTTYKSKVAELYLLSDPNYYEDQIYIDIAFNLTSNNILVSIIDDYLLKIETKSEYFDTYLRNIVEKIFFYERRSNNNKYNIRNFSSGISGWSNDGLEVEELNYFFLKRFNQKKFINLEKNFEKIKSNKLKIIAEYQKVFIDIIPSNDEIYIQIDNNTTHNYEESIKENGIIIPKNKPCNLKFLDFDKVVLLELDINKKSNEYLSQRSLQSNSTTSINPTAKVNDSKIEESKPYKIISLDKVIKVKIDFSKIKK